MLFQLVPGPFIALQAAEDVLHEDRAGGVAVGVARAGESADAAEEALQLRARMMKTSGAGPSVRAGVDSLVAAIANHALDFIGDQIERAIPASRRRSDRRRDHRARRPGRVRAILRALLVARRGCA